MPGMSFLSFKLRGVILWLGTTELWHAQATPLVRPCSILLACLQHLMLHDDVVATRRNFGEGRLGFARRGDRSQLARMQGISKQSTGATCRHKKYIGASYEDGVRSRLFPTTK
jgi:hypothetical protein